MRHLVLDSDKRTICNKDSKETESVAVSSRVLHFYKECIDHDRKTMALRRTIDCPECRSYL